MREDWIEVDIADVSEVLNGDRGKNYPSRAHYVENGIPFISAGNIGENRKLKNELNYISEDKFELLRAGKLKKNDIVYCIRGSIGKFTIIEFEKGAIASSLCIIRTSEEIDRKYFCNYLASSLCNLEINTFDNGTAQPNLSAKDFKKFKLPLAPIPIQRAIVSKIETLFSGLDKGISDLKKAQDQLKIYRQAVLKKAFEGELTKEWRENQINLPTADELLEQIKQERQNYYKQQIEDWNQAVKTWEENGKKVKKPRNPKEPQYLDDLTAEELKGIKVTGGFYTKMGNLSDVVRGGSPRPAGDERFYNGPIPFLKVADLTRRSGMYVDSYEYSIKEAGLKKTRLLKTGTLVISNSGATLGVPKITAIEATANDGIAAFLGLSKSRSEFLYHYWNSKTTELRAIDQGAGQPNLNTDLLKEYPVPVFSESEQFQIIKEIESRLSVCDKIEQNITESLNKSEALRQSILKKAFEGKLLSETEIEKCKNEADYEPASELLKKIKAEKNK